jgi:hypothetical protein
MLVVDVVDVLASSDDVSDDLSDDSFSCPVGAKLFRHPI